MLIQLMMAPLLGLINFIISLLPVLSTVPRGFGALLNIIGYGCGIIGTDFFFAVIGNIVFWLNVHLTWALIEWVYKKIPGIK